MARPKGKARAAAAAAAAASHNRSPDDDEVPPDIMRDLNHSERFAELGSFALSLALTTHLAAAYPEAPASLLDHLRDLNLSRHNLTQVAYRLESKGLIVVKKATQKRSGSNRGMDAYGIGVAGDFTLATPQEPNKHKMWEAVRLPLEVGGGVVNFCLGLRFHMLAAGLFDAEMKGVIEAVPRYKAFSLKK